MQVLPIYAHSNHVHFAVYEAPAESDLQAVPDTSDGSDLQFIHEFVIKRDVFILAQQFFYSLLILAGVLVGLGTCLSIFL